MHPDGYDPMQHSVEYWELDKPCLVGEADATGGDFYTPQSFSDGCFNNGYIGVAYWVSLRQLIGMSDEFQAYNADFPWSSAIPAWKEMHRQHPRVTSYATLVSWI